MPVAEPSELAQRYIRASRGRARTGLAGVAAFVALSLAGAWTGTRYFSSAHLEWDVTASDGREVPDYRVSLSSAAGDTDFDWAWWRRWFLKPGTDYWLKVHADGYYEWGEAIRIPTVDATRVYKVTLVPEDPARNMVPVERGCFTMGSDEGDSDLRPPREVCLSESFRIGRTEVTFAEYQRFERARGLEPPGDSGWGRGSRPVINVTWEDAVAYAQWLSEETGRRYRLPTEAEWEYAARAGTLTTYWWGDDVKESGKVWANCDGCGSFWDNDRTAPVGSFAANAFGLHDTAGNVWEWVRDCWHESYDGAPTDGSPWEESDCGLRVLRGGSWSDGPGILRSASRYRGYAGGGGLVIGFRLAQDL